MSPLSVARAASSLALMRTRCAGASARFCRIAEKSSCTLATWHSLTGMGTLARLLTSARRCGGDLRLCNVGGEVLKVLQITRLNTLFQILQSEEDAVSSFSQGIPVATQRGCEVGLTRSLGNPEASPDRSQQCASANVFVSGDERYTFGARRRPDESVGRIIGIVIGELRGQCGDVRCDRLNG